MTSLRLHSLPLLLTALLLTACSGSEQLRLGNDDSGPLIDRAAIAAADDMLVKPLRDKGARVAVIVGDPASGRLYYATDGLRLMLPASVQKLFVAADAKLRLGTEYQFTTTVFSNGPLDSTGLLQGDLVISGGWDPTLSGSHPYSHWPWDQFDYFARELYEAGLREIGGKIVVEADAFVPGGWEIGDLGERYAPRIAQLMWNDGLVSHAQQMSGQKAVMPMTAVWPDPVFWTVDHHTIWPREMAAVVAPEQDHVPEPDLSDTPDGPGPADSIVEPDGEIQEPVFERNTWKVRYQPSPSPRALAADALRASLRRAGVRGGDSTLVIPPRPLRMPLPAYDGLQRTLKSQPLDSVLAPMLQVSSNTWAEQIAAACGTWTDDQRYAPTWPAVIDSFALDGARGLYAGDACGMSRRNRMRPVTVHQLLAAAYGRWGDDWVRLLPHADQGGSSLEGRMEGLDSRVRMKTGTLSDARSLAGYILDERGRPLLAVTILVNQAPENPVPVMDRYVRHLAELVAGE